MKNILIKTPEQIEGIAAAGKQVANFFDFIRPHVKPGVKTIELDKLAEQFVATEKGIAAFREVPNYFHSTCISINEQIVHGIPSERVVAEGDIVKIDFGFKKNGFIGDACRTFIVGEVPSRVRELVDVTETALNKAIEVCQIGKRIGDIGFTIQRFVESHRFSVVREYVGHGVGIELHEPPNVPHYGHKNTGIELKEGMVIAIEPMINMGTWRSKALADGWTVVTMDGKWSAQFEHTIAITKDGPRILTL